MKKGLVSVIVPVYMTEKYLKRCIESILTQSYNNVELLLIDDGSKDSSYLLCNSYVNRFQNVKVIRQNNNGPGNARNTGITEASGEFILFVDSDDGIDKNHISDLIKAHKTSNSLVLCGYKRINKENVQNYSPGNNKLNKSEFASFVNKWMLSPMVGSPCNKLFEIAIISDNNLMFPEEYNFAEDFIFSMKYFDCIDSIITIDSCTYNYYEDNPHSLSKINSIDVRRRWQGEKFVCQQIRTCVFLSKSNVFYKIVCYMVLLNYIQQLRKEKEINSIFLNDFENDSFYKESLRKIKGFESRSVSAKLELFYKLLRFNLLTDFKVVKKFLNYILFVTVRAFYKVKKMSML